MNPNSHFVNDFVYALQNIITHSKLGPGYAICLQSFTICVVVNQHFTIHMEIEDVGISYNHEKGDLENGKKKRNLKYKRTLQKKKKTQTS